MQIKIEPIHSNSLQGQEKLLKDGKLFQLFYIYFLCLFTIRDLGVATMKKGEKALFTIAPEYAYVNKYLQIK